MAKSKTPWMPIAIGGTLILGGWWLYTQSQNGSGETDPDTEILIDAILYKLQNTTEYLDLIFADGRTPTEQEHAIYEMMHQDVYLEEQALRDRYRERYYQALTEFYRTLGLYVILPSVIGLIGIGGLAYWWAHRKPPGGTPPTCPKDGQMFTTPQELQDHIRQAHSVRTDAVTLQQADLEWQSLPFCVTSSVTIIGKVYNAPTHMVYWDPNTLLEGLGGMGFAYGSEMGTATILATLQRTLILCLI